MACSASSLVIAIEKAISYAIQSVAVCVKPALQEVIVTCELLKDKFKNLLVRLSTFTMNF